MTHELKIARDLSLPLAIVGEVTTIIAKRGAGKTNAAKVVAEEVLDTGLVQVVVLDPIGVWWALRAGANGKPRGGYDVAVFGGMHGDLPLEATAGRLLAETVVDSGQSVVLDVSDLDSDGAMQKFVLDFAERLYRLKQAKPTPLLLILEESDEFAPQDTRGTNVPRMVGAINRIAKRGRGRGIGLVPVTQRSAALNKNVLDQSDTLVILRTTGPRDRKAIKDWTEFQKAEGFDQIAPSLPGLKTGEAFVWTPERELLERVQIRKARTFDSGKTPEPGEEVVEAEVKPIDLEALGEKIRATVERVKENDPTLLRKRIADLQRELATRPTETREVPVERIVEVPALSETDLARLDSLFENYEHVAGTISSAAANLDERYADFVARLAEIRGKVAGAAAEREQNERGGGRTIGAGRPSPRPAPAPASNGAVAQLGTGGAPRAILTVLAQWPAGRTQSQISILSGYSRRSSTFQNGLSTLRKQELISPAGTDPIRITEQGLAEAGPVDAPPTGEALFAYWRQKLGQGAPGAFLEALYRAYPNELSHDELAEQSGYSSRSSTFQNGLSKLRKLDLAEGYGGSIRASADLFEEVFA